MAAELHDDQGHAIYVNGWFKWIIGAVMIAMWGLLVIMGQGFASEQNKKTTKNQEDIVQLKVALSEIKADIKHLKESDKRKERVLEEIRRAVTD